jgi:hypothetical protein
MKPLTEIKEVVIVEIGDFYIQAGQFANSWLNPRSSDNDL